VTVFYVVPGEVKKAPKVSAPKIEPLKIPRISVSAPSLPKISIRFTLPTLSFKPFAPPSLGAITRIPTISIRLPSLPRVGGFSFDYIKRHVASIRVSIPRIKRPNYAAIMATKVRDYVGKYIKRILGDWGASLNWLRDRFVDIFKSVGFWIGYAIGLVMNFFWDYAIQPQINHVQKTLNDGLNKALESVREGLNKLLNDTVSKINAIVNNLNKTLFIFRRHVEDTLNSGFKNLVHVLNEKIGSINIALKNVSLAVTQYSNTIVSKLHDYFASYNAAVQGAINSVVSQINSLQKKVADAISSTVNKAFGILGTSFNDVSTKFTANLNESFARLSVSINAVADSIVRLIGFAEGKSIVVGEPKNITKEGFTIKTTAPNVKIFWIAVHRGE
ncbi:hypothetical protein DRP04_05065, partial [Archaeoglobales archaeon]